LQTVEEQSKEEQKNKIPLKMLRELARVKASPTVALNFSAVKALSSALHPYFARKVIFTSNISSKF
jgi:hypothetical protein